MTVFLKQYLNKDVSKLIFNSYLDRSAVLKLRQLNKTICWEAERHLRWVHWLNQEETKLVKSKKQVPISLKKRLRTAIEAKIPQHCFRALRDWKLHQTKIHAKRSSAGHLRSLKKQVLEARSFEKSYSTCKDQLRKALQAALKAKKIQAFEANNRLHQ